MSKQVNVEISQAGVGASDWIILGGRRAGSGANVSSIDVRPGADATITIQATINVDIDDGADVVPADEIRDLASLTDLTAAGAGLFGIDLPVKAVRINQTIGANTSTITVFS